MKVELSDISRERGSKTVLDRLHLTIESGASVVLIGPSGVGKTSLLRILAGLDEPDRGQVKFDDRVVNNPGSLVPPHKRGVGMVFQDLALWPHLSVLENVNAVCGDRKKATELLERLGWSGRLDDSPEQLSSGERQRVALARTLAAEPKLLLLDEPLLNLDPVSRAELLRQLMMLHAELGFTLLYVTHYLDEALLLGERLVFLMDGKLELEGPLEEVITASLSPELKRFLHLPGSFEVIAPRLEEVRLEPGEGLSEAGVSKVLFQREEGLYRLQSGGETFHVLARATLNPGQTVYVRLRP